MRNNINGIFEVPYVWWFRLRNRNFYWKAEAVLEKVLIALIMEYRGSMTEFLEV